MISSPRAIGADEGAGYAPGVEIADVSSMEAPRGLLGPPWGLLKPPRGLLDFLEPLFAKKKEKKMNSIDFNR